MIAAVFGTTLGFGLTWYMWWLAWLSLAVLAVSLVGRALLGDRHPVTVPAADIAKQYTSWLAKVRTITPISRALEHDRRNYGVAAVEHMQEAAE